MPFKVGDIIVGKESADEQYGVTKHNTVWIVKEILSFDRILVGSLDQNCRRKILKINPRYKFYTGEFYVNHYYFDKVILSKSLNIFLEI